MAIGRADRYVVAARLFYRDGGVAPADVSARASRLLTEQLTRMTGAS